ncbi:CDP-diacylglycerol--serine O-phosphatidyltransferase [Rodentibacter pneumotropicus]|uniref:CDP-diacylglycerol--serine O-phosphatidyltransferase n=2 Tax=Rodentibacter pneumotropicus TaxID=758 RepID=A0A1V3K6D9_9PAST|nr:CDP-diacylglycerol--serine O-phosphatidyltransferase [Rodentibacter pneumotropicus]MCQ9121801.1 CDP-diacylglycerol--serine O-phosphatidyltransferase [Rodentibacter pneumotropicus]MDC2825068.1 CDP-diacylglycerol--serine O-phosphatidyltransferase [Rodentibacter pneumotropicus]NBH74321.1 CDP-diacylglycerol--serine O-phosphatidyltransferase [Rodentibacter pneumotropicus]OOF63807.1 phosphatidylserine synthase [Rodentibacter pneumotropicus]OOF68687.1 phosphatidylserine synthase [Rodentibacter pne
MLINKLKRTEQNLKNLPFLPLEKAQVEFLFSPTEFKTQIIELIRNAKKRIYVTALYWQKDEAGQEILDEIYRIKQEQPDLDIKILVDWHRGQRNLLGAEKSATNADWYSEQRQTYQLPEDPNMFFGVPINTREVFGVLHIKGFIFDDTVLYSGASINNVYLQQDDKYRYDRYQKITNAELANSMVNFINDYLLDLNAVHPLDLTNRPRTKEIRAAIRAYRKNLANHAEYSLESAVGFSDILSVSPLFGLGASGNELNQIIEDLFLQVQENLVVCTPYFNFPRTLQNKITTLLEAGKKIEIIVGDKVANDFYIPPEQPFKMAGALPYLYESNLRHFCEKFQQDIEQGRLTIRLWKDGDNTYHLKGVWVDKDYILLTGNNLNPRAWRLDAENGLLIHDPKQELRDQVEKELNHIRQHTTVLSHYSELEELYQYPEPVQKLLKKFARIKADKLVKMIL